MTTENPFYCQFSAFDKSVFLKGFFTVMGAGGLIPAGGRQQGGDKHLIHFDQKNKGRYKNFF